ncbi:MAG: hypothetical protein IAG13_15055 [Deltaproteobacteria bacterium]|nr:hypothetical protein [Nannocystaceae bacterium]
MSFEFYRVVHIFGIVLLFTGLGALAMLSLLTRGGKADDAEVVRTRKRIAMLHGIALLVILVAGFGLMAKSGLIKTWPTWIFGKLAIFVTLGAALVFVRKTGAMGRTWLVVLPLLGLCAALLAVYKP